MKVLGIIFLVLLVGIITYLLIGTIMLYDMLSDEDDRKDLAAEVADYYVMMRAKYGTFLSRETLINLMIFVLIVEYPALYIKYK